MRLQDKTDNGHACRFLTAVTGNLAKMGADVTVEWKSYVKAIKSVGGDTDFYGSHKEITTEFLVGVYTNLNMVADQKLGRPLGKTLADARPKRTESWRSKRALENLIINLNAVRDMYEGGHGEIRYPGLRALISPEQEGIAKDISDALDQTITMASSIGMPLSEAILDPVERSKVETLTLLARTLKNFVPQLLAPALGIELGYTSVDGD